MRITTRVSIGLFLMAGLLIASLTYQLAQVERLQRINREVSLTNMEGARLSLRLLESLGGVSEFSAKYQILPDSAYQSQWREWERAVEEDLARLTGVGLDPAQREIRDRIGSGWDRYSTAVDTLNLNSGAPLPEEGLASIQTILEDVRTDVGHLIAANDATVARQAASSAEASERASSIAWLSAVVALVLAGVLSFLLYRWVSDPLRQLTRGTREIARGRFQHRLRIQGPSELSELARDFDRMAARLDELDAMKKDFVSHVSHELKSPLAAVRETIELLLDEIPGPLNAKQAHLLQLSRSGSSRLASMIADLLEMSRLEAGAAGLIPAWNDVSELARATVEEGRLVASEKDIGIGLLIDTPETEAVCDQDRIREVIANLVDNALKFSPVGSSVQLTLSLVDLPPSTCPVGSAALRGEGGPFLLLSVEDEGPGVPDDDKERIFEKFHQVRDGARLAGSGVGLGLAISRHVVEAHSGAIWVEDRSPSGSLFRVLLPRVPVRWADRASSVSASEPEDVGEGGHVTRTPGSTASSARAATFGLIATLILSGCSGAASTETVTPRPDPPDPRPNQNVMDRPFERPAPEIVLDIGWLFLSAGDFEGARARFQRVRDGSEGSRFEGEAVWGLALLHLLPESPLFDPDEAHELLEYLQSEFPHAGVGIQAAWVQGLLTDLAEVRVTVESQAQALRSLAETVDRLRSIDLNRTPQRIPSTPDP